MQAHFGLAPVTGLFEPVRAGEFAVGSFKGVAVFGLFFEPFGFLFLTSSLQGVGIFADGQRAVLLRWTQALCAQCAGAAKSAFPFQTPGDFTAVFLLKPAAVGARMSAGEGDPARVGVDLEVFAGKTVVAFGRSRCGADEFPTFALGLGRAFGTDVAPVDVEFTGFFQSPRRVFGVDFPESRVFAGEGGFANTARKPVGKKSDGRLKDLANCSVYISETRFLAINQRPHVSRRISEKGPIQTLKRVFDGRPTLRALLPLLSCFSICLVILMWQYHTIHAQRARLSFTVDVSGHRPPFIATLDGKPFQSGETCGVGFKKLRIQTLNAEPFETNLFSGYSGLSLGTLQIAHSRGTLDIEVSPAPNSVRIRGEEFERTLTNCSHETLALPSGEYRILSEFEHFSTTTDAVVPRNAAVSVAIKPQVAALDLSSDPPESNFILESPDRTISVSGQTPATIRALPIGEYRLRIWQKKYEKAVALVLTARPTNHVAVKFEYAKVLITSNPSDASIRERDSEIGSTPSILTLSPGSYSFTVTKPGHLSAHVDFTVGGLESREFAVVLQNEQFLRAMERAHAHLSGFGSNFELALQQVNEALRISPGNPAALKLRDQIRFDQNVSAARQLGRSGDFEGALKLLASALELKPGDSDAVAFQAELQRSKAQADVHSTELAAAATAARAEQRRQKPFKLFQETAAKMKFSELFPPQFTKYSRSAESAHKAVLAALKSSPAWKIQQERKVDDDIYFIEAELRKGGGKRSVMVLCGQINESDTMVCYKLWDYVVNDLDKIFVSEFKPMHPTFTTPERADLVAGYYRSDLAELRGQLNSELSK